MNSRAKGQRVLSIDTGTTESAFALMDYGNETPLICFGKYANETITEVIRQSDFDIMVYEEFASYGMPIGQTTMKSIWWNGYFCAVCDEHPKPYEPIFRKDVKMHLCGTPKAKDCNIRQAVIDKYGEPGTKKNPGMLYGVSKDVWSAIAINITYKEGTK